MNKISTAILTACVAVSLHDSALAAPILSIVSADPNGVPVNLLNDGAALLEVDLYAMCPPVENSPGSHGAPPVCIPPITSRKLAVANLNAPAGTPSAFMAYEFLDKNYRTNSLGQVVAWPKSNAQWTDFVTISTQGVGPQAFAANAFQDPSPAGCGINDGVYQWLALSNGGQLLAQVSNAACPGPFALWNGAQLKTTGALPAGYSSPTFAGINAKSQLAITAMTGTSKRALLWNGTSYSVLPLPFLSLLVGYNASEAKGINDQGDVVGNLIKSDGTRHAVIWPAGKAATNMGTLPGYKSSAVVGVNSRGMVLTCAYNTVNSTGEPSYDLNNTKSFVWDRGVRTPLSRSALGLPTDTTSQVVPEGTCAAWFHIPLMLGGVFLPQRVMANQSGQWLINDFENGVGLSVLSQVR